MRVGSVLAAVAIGGACASGSGSRVGDDGSPAERDYLVFVASEATDEVQLVRFGPTEGGVAARVERRHPVGFHPADPDGPHGLAVSSDDRTYYVTTAHGVPNGYLWKFAAEDSRKSLKSLKQRVRR
jgi:hypothetical protein